MSNVTSSSLTNLSSKKIVESQKQRQAELKKRKAELEKDLADNAAYLQSKEYLEIEVQYNSIENSIQQTLEEKKRILGKEFNETKERTCLETYFYGDTGAYEKMQNLEQQMVNHILATNGNRVHKLKTTGFLDIEGGDKIQTHLTKAEKDQLRPLAQSDITEITPVERTYQGEQYHIITCKIRGEQYTAIQVPSKLKTKSYRDTHVGRALVEHKGTNWYPAFLSVKRLANPLDQDRLIRKTEPAMQADGTPHTNISLYTDGNQEWDIVRECAKKGMRMLTITDCIIMAELIKGRFGEDYLWRAFTGGRFCDTRTETSHTDIQKKLKKIEDEFLVKYVVSTQEYQGYLNRDYSIYKQLRPKDRRRSDGSEVNEYFAWFFRGDDFFDTTALGGVASVRLNYDLDDPYYHFGFRPGV